MDKVWRGVFVIIPTPFTPDLRLDQEGLRRTTRFCIDCGVDGVVAPANASEVAYLSDAERRLVTTIVLAEAKGRVRSIVGISSSCAAIACDLAREAEDAGADALMAMPPNFQRPSEAEIRTFFEAIDKTSA